MPPTHSSSSLPPSPLSLSNPPVKKPTTPARYRACQKNYAVGIDGHAVDGSGGFMPASSSPVPQLPPQGARALARRSPAPTARGGPNRLLTRFSDHVRDGLSPLHLAAFSGQIQVRLRRKLVIRGSSASSKLISKS